MHIVCIFENEDSTLCVTKNYKSGEFWENSGESCGFSGKLDKKLFIRFHSFFQVRNTFPSWGNLIPLTTYKNYCEKKFLLSFHFPFSLYKIYPSKNCFYISALFCLVVRPSGLDFHFLSNGRVRQEVGGGGG